MAKFVLTAQLQLQPPTNTKQVVGQIRSQLSNQGIKLPVEVKGARQAENQIKKVRQETEKATNAATALGKSFGLAVKRFAAFTVASRGVSLFTNSLAAAVDEAIQFQREVIKISQVTGQSVKELRSLKNTITELSTGLGVVSKDLLAVTRILSQAGIRGQELEIALSALAKTTLAPTFDDITQTAEGVVAILAQFREGAGALENQLGAINRVAGQFAVESGDLIGAVRRFGGVFKSAGGDLEELLAIFTSVRQTTRESAESISTGLRTIFTRLQRPETIEFLRALNVELEDSQGRFKGPIEAVRLLNKEFGNLPQGDLKFITVAEELGGFRQIGKVIPLLQQRAVVERALQETQNAGNSLNKDTAKSQEALATQITKVREEFQALIRTIADSTSFQFFIRSSLKLTSALISIADAIKPLIPLLTTLGTIKIAQGIGGFFAGAGATVRGLQAAGGGVPRFASGGFVPGTGNRDTVPAMLTPGEFVIKKSSAQKLGAGTLTAMNENRFQSGGKVKDGIAGEDQVGIAVPRVVGDVPGKEKRKSVELSIAEALSAKTGVGDLNKKTIFDRLGANPQANLTASLRTGRLPKENLQEVAERTAGFDKKSVKTLVEGTTQDDFDSFDKAITSATRVAIIRASEDFSDSLGFNVPEIEFAKNFQVDGGLKGVLFEEVLDSFQGQPITGAKKGSTRPFDFTEGLEPRGTLFNVLAKEKVKFVDAKVGKDVGDSVFKTKSTNQLALDLYGSDEFRAAVKDEADLLLAEQQGGQKKSPQRRNSGGGIRGGGTDTVPALLTPGEFVIQKSAAQSIGTSALNEMNKSGVAKFASGGSVGIQRFQSGGGVLGGGAASAAIVITSLQLAIDKFGDTSEEASDAVFKTTIGLQSLLNVLLNIGIVGVAFVKARDAINKWEQNINKASDAANESASADMAAAQAAEQVAVSNKKSADSAVPESQGQDQIDRLQATNRQKFEKGEDFLAIGDQEEIDRRQRSLEASSAPPKGETPLEAAARKEREEEAAAQADVNKLTSDRVKNEEEGTKLAKRNVELQREIVQRRKEQAQANRRVKNAEDDLAKKTKSVGDLVQTRVKTEQSIERSKKRQEELIKKSAEAEAKASSASGRLSALRAGQASGAQKIDDPSRPGEGIKLSVSDVNREIERLEAELKQAEDQSKKTADEFDKVTQGLDDSETKLRAVRAQEKATRDSQKRSSKELSSANKRATNLEKKRTGAIRAKDRAEKELLATSKRLTLSTQKLAEAESKLARSQSEGRRGRFRRGARSTVAGAGRLGAGVLAGAAIASSIANQAAQITQQLADRAVDSQRDQGNVEGAARAAEAGRFAQGIGELFSIQGLVTIVTKGLKGFFDELRTAVKKAGAEEAVNTFKTVAQGVREGLDEGGDLRGPNGQANFGEGIRTLVEGATSARTRIDAVAKELEAAGKESKQVKDQLGGLNESLKENIRNFVENGASMEVATSAAVQLAGGNKQLEAEYTELANALITAREAQLLVVAANIESLKITSAFGNASSAVDIFSQSLVTGTSSLDGYVKELEAAQGTVGADVGNAINAIESALLTTAGGNANLRGAIGGQANTARAAGGFAQRAGAILGGVELNRSSASRARGQIRGALETALEGVPEALRTQFRTIVNDQVTGITKENFQQTDISDIIGNIAEQSQQLSAGFLEAGRIQAEHNGKIAALYKKREETELKAQAAANAAIEAQLEAAKAFEEFGGARLTEDQALSARISQFNNAAGLAGNAGLRTGGSSDISRVATELASVFNTQQAAVIQDITRRGAGGAGGGLFQGGQGFQNDQREDLKRANAALVQFTRQRIVLLKEELQIVQAKNREEQSALQKLISGDIQGFIQGQAAAGAGAALRSGSSGLANLFSPTALGAGFQSLEGQGLSDRELQRAASLTLGGLGITDSGSAGVLSGTTPEQEAIKAEGRELARVLGDVAQQGAQFERSDIAIQDATITATNLVFQRELGEIARANTQFRSRGGPIYASRGMFVPRGTDTVPAMLTPGEFVVNRAAVQRGNNLAMLRAMNTGGGASGPGHMSGGGRVSYYQTGGIVEGISGAFQDSLPQLRNIFSDFSAAVDRLANTQFSVKLDTTNVNVNLNGASFLATLKEDIKNELLGEVAREIGKAKQNSSGDMELRKTVL